MNFEGRAELAAGAQSVWDLLLDLDRVAACVPGLLDARQIDDDTFEGSVKAAVGPISGMFAFRSTIVERRPPEHLQAAITGADSVTKSRITGDVDVDLKAVSPTETLLTYRSSIKVDGRLALLGEMVLRATGNMMLREMVERLRRQVEGSGVARASEGG
jgi:carbon monoxide dehydrogenase subunit G